MNVTDLRPAVIRRWTCDGDALAAIGRRGNAVGQLRTPSIAFRMQGDTIGVWDRMLQRITRLGPAGNVHGAQEIAIDPEEHGFLRGMNRHPSTHLMVTERVPGMASTDARTHIWRLGDTGKVGDRVFSADGRDMLVLRDSVMTMRVAAPLGKVPFALFPSDGSVVIGHTRSPTFTVLEPTTGLVRVFEIEVPVLPVAKSELAFLAQGVSNSVSDALQQSGLDQRDVSARQRRYDRWLQTIEYPSIYPLYSTATIDDKDRMWIAQTDTATVRTWQVWNLATAKREASIEVSHSFVVVQATARAGSLFVLEVDQRGVYRVVRYIVDIN